MALVASTTQVGVSAFGPFSALVVSRPNINSQIKKAYGLHEFNLCVWYLPSFRKSWVKLPLLTITYPIDAITLLQQTR